MAEVPSGTGEQYREQVLGTAEPPARGRHGGGERRLGRLGSPLGHGGKAPRASAPGRAGEARLVASIQRRVRNGKAGC
jgi:hypothetical protein